MIDESQLQSLGAEVPVGEIDRELVRLFAGDDSPDSSGRAGMARASLLNLAVYTEEPSSAPGLSAMVEDLTRETACRAILILADPAASPPVSSPGAASPALASPTQSAQPAPAPAGQAKTTPAGAQPPPAAKPRPATLAS